MKGYSDADRKWLEEVVSKRDRRGVLRQYHDLAGADDADLGPESKLQGKITKLCKDRGWPCLSFRQSRKARGFIPSGWADLTILIPLQKRILFIELKSKAGRKTEEQKQMASIFSLAGHPIHEIRSWKAFNSLIEAENRDVGASKPEKGSWVKGGMVW